MAGHFIFWLMEFNKSGLSIEQQMALLRSRGMKFDQPDKAANYLSHISYYRLSAYWYTFIESPPENHIFKADTNFTQVINTYVFDRKLRIMLFDEIERIEVALRTQIIYHFCLDYGNNWYEDPGLFKNQEYHSEFISIIEGEIQRSNEKYISHYKRKYSSPKNPPCWMTLELACLGQLSKIYKNTISCDAKKRVAEHFKLDDIVLTSWIEFLSLLRNKCAHHSRVWNKSIPKNPHFPTNPKGDWLSVIPEKKKQNLVYTAASIILYLVRCIVPDTSFPDRFFALLKQYSNIPRHYMGFPQNWEEDIFWMYKNAPEQESMSVSGSKLMD
jgi:abortive infection bacteriophage resistance protein